MDLGGFIGRFHPLVVHLPIGFLIAAAVFEYYSRKRRNPKLDTAVSMSLFLGAAFAIVASVSGWLLANRGAYLEQSLFLHRWLGITVAVLASLAWLVKTRRISLAKSVLTGLMTTMMLALLAAGHFGGNMTHGEDYLFEYAPGFVKNIFGMGQEHEDREVLGPPDSIKIYADLIEPIFQEQCWKCHKADNALGGLDLSTKNNFLKGGDNGKVLEVGAAYESELFHRITLPVSNRKSMPPVGLALSYPKIRLIEWWINAGASFGKTLADLEVPDDILNLLLEEYGISFKQPNAVDRISVSAADAVDIAAARDGGFQVEPLSGTSNLLEVSAGGEVNLKALDPIKTQITWLNLADSNIDDSQVEQIAEFSHVTRLRLQGNPVTDGGVAALEGLAFLESINLNRTRISAQALKTLQNMPGLKRVYLFETDLTEEDINALQTARPDLELVRGFQWSQEN